MCTVFYSVYICQVWWPLSLFLIGTLVWFVTDDAANAPCVYRLSLSCNNQVWVHIRWFKNFQGFIVDGSNWTSHDKTSNLMGNNEHILLREAARWRGAPTHKPQAPYILHFNWIITYWTLTKGFFVNNNQTNNNQKSNTNTEKHDLYNHLKERQIPLVSLQSNTKLSTKVIISKAWFMCHAITRSSRATKLGFIHT